MPRGSFANPFANFLHRMSAYLSKADFHMAQTHVRFSPKADIIATAQIAPKADVSRAVYGWSRMELSLARADSAMLVDPAGASREKR